jgi:hypothetical protein
MNLRYSSCTNKNNENTCNSYGGAHEKGNIGWNLVYHHN